MHSARERRVDIYLDACIHARATAAGTRFERGPPRFSTPRRVERVSVSPWVHFMSLEKPSLAPLHTRPCKEGTKDAGNRQPQLVRCRTSPCLAVAMRRCHAVRHVLRLSRMCWCSTHNACPRNKVLCVQYACLQTVHQASDQDSIIHLGTQWLLRQQAVERIVQRLGDTEIHVRTQPAWIMNRPASWA